ncbi:hypothetical protein BVI1335_1220045 [Burkholderia vietnamiensis]|nr:hypothetical protein BVI1335_1220045 [Burkholderia vietnamiensis]
MRLRSFFFLWRRSVSRLTSGALKVEHLKLRSSRLCDQAVEAFQSPVMRQPLHDSILSMVKHQYSSCDSVTIA